ncbi:hypothetical protein CAP35_10395 [Chitinophagaceae bacterium IBVUCB1]|nr:hypothetical protein CAP35_10395 [Chitinophagaceae bacterium IBVUCB1]
MMDMKKLLLSLAAMAGFATAGTAQTITDSLKACYAFSSADSFKDGISGNILTSINAVHTRTTDRFGGNNGIRFTAAGYLSAGNDTKYNVKEGMTISAWIFIDTLMTGEGAIASKWDNGSGDQYLFGLYSNNKLALALQGKTYELTMLSKSTLLDTTWYHVAMTWTKGGMTVIYVNGNPDTASTLIDSIVTTSTVFNIGGQGMGLLRYFRGTIDDFRFYNRALSPTEMTTLYTKDSACGLKYTPPPTTVKSIITNGTLKVYPNPATTSITVQTANDATLQILDMKGALVKEQYMHNTTTIDITRLQAGIYIARLTDADGNRSTARFIKE